MGNFNTLRSGLNHAPAYQVSGRPWATGSCVAPISGTLGSTVKRNTLGENTGFQFRGNRRHGRSGTPGCL